MLNHFSRVSALIILFAFSAPAHAEFVITSAILEFTNGGPSQQDIELVSHAKDSDYIVSEVSEITHPGAPDEARHLLDDPQNAGLLVTPDKTILSGGGRKVLRFVLLHAPDAQEHIYRVAIKPVIRGVDNTSKVGLKVLIGYEVLVIVRPATPTPSYTVERHGKTLLVTNMGNTNVLLQNGTQCPAGEGCKLPPVIRVYAGQRAQVELPLDRAVTYTVWDGATSVERHVD